VFEIVMRSLLIDILRILGVTLLLFGHLYSKLHGGLDSFWLVKGIYLVSPGILAVQIFLFISGVSLQLQYGSRSYKYIDYMLKRILRIYPVYYLSLIIGIVVFLYRDYQKTGIVFSCLASFNIQDLMLSLSGFYVFFDKWGGPFVRTSWFVGLIISLYFVFPFLSKCIRKNPHVWIIIFFLISFVSRYLITRYTSYPFHLFRWFPLCRIFEFSFGIYLAVVVKSSLWYVLNTKFSLLQKTFEFIGKLSFPLFLVHMPFIYFVGVFMENGYSNFTIVILFLVVTTALSWIVLKLDECVPRKRIIEMFVGKNLF
jgi:peptidoglycan/LPS O-acetylase OafA/YrhL